MGSDGCSQTLCHRADHVGTTGHVPWDGRPGRTETDVVAVKPETNLFLSASKKRRFAARLWFWVHRGGGWQYSTALKWSPYPVTFMS